MVPCWLWRGAGDVRRGALCGGSTGGCRRGVEPSRGGPAVRHRPPDGEEDAEIRRRRATGGRSLCGDRSWTGSPASSTDPGGGHGSGGAAQAAAHGAPDLRASSRRARVQRRLHHREGLCAFPAAICARGLRATAPSAAMPRSTSARDGRGRRQAGEGCLLLPILPHSNVWFVKAYPRETTEAFLDGHVSALAFLGGCHARSSMTTRPLARILGDGTRRRTQGNRICSATRFGRPGKGNDKGKVEALVKTARRRFMVPIPKVHDLSVLNERLLARCLERLDALEAGGQAAALLADLEALRAARFPSRLASMCGPDLVQLPAGGLLGGGARPQEGYGEGGPGRDRARRRDRRPPSALLCPRRRRLRPAALSVAAGEEAGALDQRRCGDGSSTRPSARCGRLPALRPARQARIHPGAAPARRLPGTAGGGRGARRGEATPDRLRRSGQAPAAGPHREAAGPSRPVALSAAPAPSPPRGGRCWPEGPAMAEAPPHPARTSPEAAEAADLPAGYEKLARQCAAEGLMSSSWPGWWAGADRPRGRARIKQAGFPVAAREDFKAIPASTRCWCWISRAASTSRAART